MAEAETSDARLAYSRESVFGTNPGTGAKFIRITAAGVRSDRGEALVHATGAYTLNEVPGSD